MKHTKGPWTIGTDRISVFAKNRVGTFNATIKIFDVTTGLEPKPADAFLIAAAPDMLEALEVAHRALLLANLLLSAYEVEQVIKKAKGE